jgi:hypothetical protein
MTGALIPRRSRPADRLERLRRQARRALAPAAFIAETLAVTAGLFILITAAVLQFDPITVVGVWGSFLTHYAEAPPSSRAPIDRVLIVVLVILAAFVAACRWPGRRSSWRSYGRAGEGRA